MNHIPWRSPLPWPVSQRRNLPCADASLPRNRWHSPHHRDVTYQTRTPPAPGAVGAAMATSTLLGAHYRSPLEYSHITMQAARAEADDFRQAFRVAVTRPSDLTCESIADTPDDGFDTPRALAVVHGWRAAGQLDIIARGLAGSGSRSIGRGTSRRPTRTGAPWTGKRRRPPGLRRGRPAPGRAEQCRSPTGAPGSDSHPPYFRSVGRPRLNGIVWENRG